MRIQVWVLSTALMFVPVALTGQSPGPGSNPVQNSQDSSLSKQDLLFLHVLASEDQSEIDLANLALKKSANPQVQQYVRSKILGADPSMRDGAISVAQQNHASVSSSPNATAKAQYDILAMLSGDQFDRSYIGYENRQQAADLQVVQGEVSSTGNPQVRSYAQSEVAPVRQASQAAAQLAHVMKIDSVP